MKLGIVGLTNTGKTALFNALTHSRADTSSYLFGTVEPNLGKVAVPDSRLQWLSSYYSPKKTTPAYIEFVDIPGLVRGSSSGEGLGNKFLSHIRQVDAIVHVVRCFIDENVAHPDGSVDPARDIETVNLELIVADVEMLERRIEKANKAAKGDKKYAAEAELCGRLVDHLSEGLPARSFKCTDDELEIIRTSDLLTLKPVIYAANVGESYYSSPDDALSASVAAIATSEGAESLPVCAKLEQELDELDEDDKAMFLEELGITETGLTKFIQGSYSLLNLISFLTAGKDECRAWTIKKGTKAPKAAGKIHSDLERGFIRAEVVAFEDFKADGSMSAAKSAGHYRSEGKEYVVCDGDVMNILFNV